MPCRDEGGKQGQGKGGSEKHGEGDQTAEIAEGRKGREEEDEKAADDRGCIADDGFAPLADGGCDGIGWFFALRPRLLIAGIKMD